jgi:hypothetical protein
MILILAEPNDPLATCVQKRIEEHGRPVRRLSEQDLMEETPIALERDGCRFGGFLRMPGGEVRVHKLRDLVTALGGLQTQFPERIKPEHIKPEHFKPEWWKPEWIKPEAFKPEIFKEFAKPELTKPIDIDQLFDPVLEGLSQDQLKRLADKVQQRLG